MPLLTSINAGLTLILLCLTIISSNTSLTLAGVFEITIAKVVVLSLIIILSLMQLYILYSGGDENVG